MSENAGSSSRRAFLGSSVLAGLAAAGCSRHKPAALRTSPSRLAAQGQAWNPTTNPSTQVIAQASLPSGQLGKVKLSRLIAGGNLLSGWCHQRDLLYVRRLAEAYLDEKKQFDTLQLMEESGINAIMIDMVQLPIVDKYRKERGGKMQTVASVRQDWGSWGRPNLAELKTEISRTIDQGADLIYLHGGYCDALVRSGKSERIEIIGQSMQYIREKGLLAGLGSHALEVPIECEKRGMEPDYFVKTFHHDQYWSATPKDRRKPFCVDGKKHLDHNEFHDNIFCIDPEETAAFMLRKKQPWMAFKVLAAGAIEPKSGFAYAFENGADFIAVGMFDFDVAPDIKALNEVLPKLNRQRAWMA